jgi:hypothetical protein
MSKQLGSKLIFVAIIGILILSIAGCGGGEESTGGTTSTPPGATPTATATHTPTHTPTHTATPTPLKTSIGSTAPTYQFGESISFGGATFVIKSARKTNEITVTSFGETDTYTPDKGMYVIVYFTFQGNANNENAGVDAQILRLKDSRGYLYLFNSDLNNNESNDLALAELKGLNLLSMCSWNNTGVKDLLQVFDVDADATGLKLEFWDSTLKVKAQVPLGF